MNNNNEKDEFIKIWFYCFIVLGYLSVSLIIYFLKYDVIIFWVYVLVMNN